MVLESRQATARNSRPSSSVMAMASFRPGSGRKVRPPSTYLQGTPDATTLLAAADTATLADRALRSVDDQPVQQASQQFPLGR